MPESHLQTHGRLLVCEVNVSFAVYIPIMTLHNRCVKHTHISNVHNFKTPTSVSAAVHTYHNSSCSVWFIWNCMVSLYHPTPVRCPYLEKKMNALPLHKLHKLSLECSFAKLKNYLDEKKKGTKELMTSIVFISFSGTLIISSVPLLRRFVSTSRSRLPS